MDGILWLILTEKVYVNVVGENGKTRGQRVHLEQNIVDCIQDLVNKISKPGELLVLMFSGTFVTGNACLNFRATVISWAAKLMPAALQKVRRRWFRPMRVRSGTISPTFRVLLSWLRHAR